MGKYVWPCPGYSRMSSDYGYRIHPISGDRKFHDGIDLAAPSGTDILACGAGTVTISNRYTYRAITSVLTTAAVWRVFTDIVKHSMSRPVRRSKQGSVLRQSVRPVLRPATICILECTETAVRSIRYLMSVPKIRQPIIPAAAHRPARKTRACQVYRVLSGR